MQTPQTPPTLPDFSAARVLVVGDVMLDRYWQGPCIRISPEAPVPVVRVEDIENRPGGAANVAVNIASLGAGVTVLGLIGEDEAARTLGEQLSQRGVAYDFLPAAGPTITKLRVLSRHQQLIRLDFEDGFSEADPQALLRRYRRHLPQSAVAVLSDYGKGALREVQRFIEAARAKALPVLVDPKGKDFDRYRNATLITPNLAEFQAVVGDCRDAAEIADKGLRLIEELSLQALLVTRGEQGMTLLKAAAEPLHLAAKAREVYDVTGAGDTVIAVVAAGLAAGFDLAQATVLANAAAGLVVGKLGTAGVSAAQLYSALHAENHRHIAFVDQTQLLQAVEISRARGETIVMTNGCFDILHPGHVTYLEQAKRLGDKLIVAINDDDSVSRLKGPARPVNPLAARQRVLAGLAAVDWVIAFSEDTPERLVCELLPDVLVKGGDYSPDAVAGGDCVRRAGGRVVILDFVEGYSTSEIIRRTRPE